MDTKNLRAEYERKIDLFKQLEDTTKFILSKEIKRNNIQIHSFPSRIKSFDSILDKMRRRGIDYSLTKIRDIVGLRIVCLFLNDINDIAKIIRDTFEVLEEENERSSEYAEIFGYMLPQFKVKLRDIDRVNQEYILMKDIPFEVQLRTIAQDAWASISHHLEYKQRQEIPDHLKRDFYALNGLFYVADTHFEMIKEKTLNILT